MNERTKKSLRMLCNPFVILMLFFVIQGVAFYTLNTEIGDVRAICSEIIALIMLVFFMIDKTSDRIQEMKDRIEVLENGDNRE